MPRSAILIATAVFLATPRAMAADPDDRHLPVIARTPAEIAQVASLVQPPGDFLRAELGEGLPGGAATVAARDTSDAFSQPSANLDPARTLEFKAGNGLFRKNWVAAPASTPASDGLGPLYNARGCEDCHVQDGRGRPPQDGDISRSMVLRLSIPGGQSPSAIEDYLATLPDPIYGEQLQDLASPGQMAEGTMNLSHAALPVELSGGTTVMLQAPSYAVAEPRFGPLDPTVMLSPRVAPQMIGLGLLEAIPAGDILALTDETDANRDGISGRANIVWSIEHGIPMLGRFGLKAGTPTLRHQLAAAFSIDMGLSTSLFPAPSGDCTEAQTACIAAPNGQEPGLRDGVEVDDQSLDLLTFYSRNLGVPARRAISDPLVLAGKRVFHEVGCASCHQPEFVTHRLEGQPEQSFQVIWPYSDLLLHDMGDGLADNRPEARATGREWRTAPLWGIGLTQAVSGHTRFLHDGRARSLLEAILWHGGEAEAARRAVTLLPRPDREALIAFLQSL